MPADRSNSGVLAPGAVIARRYELEHVLGQGGYGTVFRARALNGDQRVAVKVLTGTGRGAEDVALKRFFREAETTSTLRHPNTIRVIEHGIDGSGTAFIVMELLSGRTLKQDLTARATERRPYEEREIVEIGIAIASSLVEAHAAGLVHRDLKPGNVYLHQGSAGATVVKVLDFGLVKQLDGAPLTGIGAVLGSPAYMSPEQVRGEPVDERTDIYSLGVILHALTALAPPFSGTQVEVMKHHVGTRPPDLRIHAKSAISRELLEVIERALEKRRERRFASAQQLRSALEKLSSASWADAPEESTRIDPEVRPPADAWNEAALPTLSGSVLLPEARLELGPIVGTGESVPSTIDTVAGTAPAASETRHGGRARAIAAAALAVSIAGVAIAALAWVWTPSPNPSHDRQTAPAPTGAPERSMRTPPTVTASATREKTAEPPAPSPPPPVSSPPISSPPQKPAETTTKRRATPPPRAPKPARPNDDKVKKMLDFTL